MKAFTLWTTLLFVLLVLSMGCYAAEVYVSPSGTPQGPGTRQSPYDLITVLAGKAGVNPGDTVWLLGGVYDKADKIKVTLSGTPNKPIIVRQAPGQRATIFTGNMQVKGADVWYWGFEVRGLRGTPREKQNQTSLDVFGPRTKFINLTVHCGLMGYGFWTPAVDAEIYGNIIYDFGFPDKAGGRGHGHACYTQNERGTKRIVDNIMFAGHGWNQHNYTQKGKILGYHIEGNIFFSAGMASRPADPPKDNIFISAYAPADRYTVIDNIAYHPRSGGSRPNARFGTYKKDNGSIILKNNYFMGLRGMSIDRWKKVVATGNEVWAPGPILQVKLANGAAWGDWQVDGNTYHALLGESKFNGKKFGDYRKATGLDGASKLIPTVNGRPTGQRIFVRPNRYEPGRAHIAVFNWARKKTVKLDLSRTKLRKGRKFRIRNVQDLFGKPVAEGTYTGKHVTVPLMASPIAPDFDAFLVIPEESFGSFTARPDDPKPDWSKINWSQLKWKRGG